MCRSEVLSACELHVQGYMYYKFFPAGYVYTFSLCCVSFHLTVCSYVYVESDRPLNLPVFLCAHTLCLTVCSYLYVVYSRICMYVSRAPTPHTHVHTFFSQPALLYPLCLSNLKAFN